MELEFVFVEDLLLEDDSSNRGTFETLDTGVYDVVINFVALDKTSKGNNTISIDLTTDTGHSTKIWRAFGSIDKVWASGKENFGYHKFQEFMAACGAKSITAVPYTIKKSDGSVVKEVQVIKELQGAKCKLAIQKEYDFYNNKEHESNVIHTSFNSKGQTYKEAKKNEEAVTWKKVAERLTDSKTKRYKAKDTVPFESNEPTEESLL